MVTVISGDKRENLDDYLAFYEKYEINDAERLDVKHNNLGVAHFGLAEAVPLCELARAQWRRYGVKV